MVMIYPYYGILCNNSKKAVTHEDIKKKKKKEKLYAIPSRWQKYFQNNIVYMNTIKTKPFILMLNIHLRDSKRYADTTLIKVFTTIYIWA